MLAPSSSTAGTCVAVGQSRLWGRAGCGGSIPLWDGVWRVWVAPGGSTLCLRWVLSLCLGMMLKALNDAKILCV